MKQLCLLLLLIGSAGATVFTAQANGDWQATATWGSSGTGCHAAYPCMTDTYSAGPTNGDVVNLNGHTVTCGPGETCSVGASNTITTASVANCVTTGTTPAALVGVTTGAGLIIKGTSTFIYAGLICLRYGNLIADSGAKIYHDSSWAATPAGYVFTDNDGTTSNTTAWCIGDSSCGAVAGSNPVLWEGDSWASPQKNSANCTTPLATGCVSGTIVGNVSSANSGSATVTNAVFQNISPNSQMWAFRSTNATGKLKVTNTKFTNTGSIGYNTTSFAYNIVFDGVTCTSSGTGHALLVFGGMNSPSTLTISNSWLECQVIGTSTWYPANTGSNPLTSLIIINSVFKQPWSSGAAFLLNNYNTYGGNNTNNVIQTDQVMYYVDSYGGTGATVGSETSPPGGSGATNMMTAALLSKNSILQIPRNQTAVSGTHLHPASVPKVDSTTVPTSANPWYAINNVYSGFGSVTTNPATEGNQQGYSSGGIAFGTSSMVNYTAFNVYGNVMTCGAYGRSPMAGIPGQYPSQTMVTNGNGAVALSVTVAPSTPSSGSATYSAASNMFGGASAPVGANFYLYQGGSTENINNIGPYPITSSTATSVVVSDPSNLTASQTISAVPAYGWWGAGSFKIHNNTLCTGIGTLTTAQLNGGGYAGTESGGSAFGALDVNGNLFFRADGPGIAAVPSYGGYEITSGVGHANYVNNPAFGGVPMAHSVIYNAEVNGLATDASNAPCINTSPALSCTFSVIKPTASTDMILVNQLPQMVDPTRNFIDFGLYLDRNNLFPGGQNAATFYASPHTIDLGSDNSIPAVTGTNPHQGATTVTTTAAAAWSNGTVYVPGNIVYVDGTLPVVSGPPVIDYTKSLQGRRSYWVCKIGHTAGPTNAPIIGSDSNNWYIGPTAVWEDAWMTLWLKPAVLGQNANSANANKLGITIFEDGNLPPLYNSPTTYAVGLINRYIRAGFVVNDPRLWGFYSGTNQCNTSSAGGAGTQVECGGVTKPMIQHIPPPVVTN